MNALYAASDFDDSDNLLLVEIDAFVLMARNAGADLRGSPSLLCFLIGVKAFLGAGGTLSTVCSLVAAAQAGVAQGAVAAAIARQLVDHVTNLGRQQIGMHLPGVAEVLACQLRAVENRRQGVDVKRRRGVIGGNVVSRVRPLCITGRCERENSQAQRPAALNWMLHQFYSTAKSEIRDKRSAVRGQRSEIRGQR